MAMTLKAARVNKDMTQEEAAAAIGVSVSTLAKWEQYKAFPSTKQVADILEAYGADFDEIIFLPEGTD